jgi:hypothetical protein
VLAAGFAAKGFKDKVTGRGWSGMVKGFTAEGVMASDGKPHPFADEGLGWFVDLFFEKGGERYPLTADDHEALAYVAVAAGAYDLEAGADNFDVALASLDKAAALDPARAARLAVRRKAIEQEKAIAALVRESDALVREVSKKLTEYGDLDPTKGTAASQKARNEVIAAEPDLRTKLATALGRLDEAERGFLTTIQRAWLGDSVPAGAQYAGETLPTGATARARRPARPPRDPRRPWTGARRRHRPRQDGPRGRRRRATNPSVRPPPARAWPTPRRHGGDGPAGDGGPARPRATAAAGRVRRSAVSRGTAEPPRGQKRQAQPARDARGGRPRVSDRRSAGGRALRGPDGRVLVPLKVVPGASRSKVVGPLGDRLKLAVAAPPSAAPPTRRSAACSPRRSASARGRRRRGGPRDAAQGRLGPGSDVAAVRAALERRTSLPCRKMGP